MSESGNRPGVENKQELNISSPEIIFGVDADFEEHIGSLAEACSTNNPDEIVELLDSKQFVENTVVKKGKKNNKEWLKLFERAVDIITQIEIGKGIKDVSDTAELERVIKSTKLSPFAVAEFTGALYHMDRDDECERLARIISASESSVVGAVAQAYALNSLGSLYSRQGAAQGSLEANKKGLEVLSNESSDNFNVRWQTSKLKHGLLVGRMERRVFPDMPEQFFKIRREREAVGDTFHLGRVDLDAARAFAALKERDEAIHYAERARDLMVGVGYWSAAEQANELLNKLKQKG